MGSVAKIDDKRSELVEIIAQRKYSGSYELAIKTIEFLQKFIQNSCAKNVKELLLEVAEISTFLKTIDTTESVVENMIQRILKLVHEESLQTNGNQSQRINPEENLLIYQPVNSIDCEDVISDDFKDSIVLAINELISELETSGDNIAKQSLEMIHTSEIIMTIGRSKTVELYLKHAAKNKRKFQVIVAECAPFYNGHQFAASLAKEGISTTLIPDSGIFSVMCRVNKVVIGAHSIMTNGGVKAVSGANTLALAAKHYSVPFIVCTGMYKLSPEIEDFDHYFNKFSSSQEVLNYRMKYSTNCQVVNPVFDYVPPELISVFASNIGGMFPSYLYRLLLEFYLMPDQVESLKIDH